MYTHARRVKRDPFEARLCPTRPSLHNISVAFNLCEIYPSKCKIGEKTLIF